MQTGMSQTCLSGRQHCIQMHWMSCRYRSCLRSPTSVHLLPASSCPAQLTWLKCCKAAPGCPVPPTAHRMERCCCDAGMSLCRPVWPRPPAAAGCLVRPCTEDLMLTRVSEGLTLQLLAVYLQQLAARSSPCTWSSMWLMCWGQRLSVALPAVSLPLAALCHPSHHHVGVATALLVGSLSEGLPACRLPAAAGCPVRPSKARLQCRRSAAGALRRQVAGQSDLLRAQLGSCRGHAGSVCWGPAWCCKWTASTTLSPCVQQD